MNWLLPDNAATFGGIDSLYYLILVITGIVFLIVQVALIYFVVKYRYRPGRKAEYITGNARAELIWTAIPFFILIFLAFRSYDVWLDIRSPDRLPEGAFEVHVLATQFEWHVTYPGEDGVLGTEDDFTVRNRLNIPVDMPVIVHLTSNDVIHSFFVPAFRVKQDAVPGMTIPVWFQATQVGEYVLGCAELCGIGHYRMRGTVTVQAPEDFADWQREEAAQWR
jgi:cytochrome c oxidase subunit II